MIKDCDLIKKLHLEGLPQRQIAGKLGLSQSTISKRLNKLGMGRYSWFRGSLSTIQRSILVGTLLGDAHMRLGKGSKSPILELSHGKKQREYIIWKAAHFEGLFKSLEPYVNKSGVDGKYETLKLVSRAHPVFMPWFKVFYADQIRGPGLTKKKISDEVIVELQDKDADLTWAIWFCDDGSVRRSLGRRPNILWYAGGLVMKDYHRIEVLLEKHFGCRPRREHWLKYGRWVSWRFTSDDSEVVASRLFPYVPSCMRWKISGFNIGSRPCH